MSKQRKLHLFNTYNLTEEQYNSLLENQNFRCKICGKPWTFGTLQVDHDHKTNKIRGLLCRPCNVLLGMANDNQTILLKAIQYLRGKLI